MKLRGDLNKNKSCFLSLNMTARTIKMFYGALVF
jgi:hypothetical protein